MNKKHSNFKVASFMILVLFISFVALQVFIVSEFHQSATSQSKRSLETYSELIFQTIRTSMNIGDPLELQKSLKEASLKKGIEELKIHISQKVIDTFEMNTKPSDNELIKNIFKKPEAKSFEIEDSFGHKLRFIKPLIATNECMMCHNKNAIGDVLGVMDITYSLDQMYADIEKSSYKLFYAFMFLLVIAVFVIVSIFKKLEIAKNKATEANTSKSEFLANMSHEIRTPLNAILGFVNVLKEQEVDKEKQEYLRIIDSSSKTLLSTIGDILDFSKMETGKLEVENIDFNARDEFENVVFLFDAQASRKNILLSIKVDEKLPKFIKADIHKIKQITSNLISNAIKFTGSKQKIEVVVNYKENFLHVAVIDQGKGIKKDKLAHIFEAFGQEDSSTTRQHGGTGLGLSISSLLAKLLGGELKVESELGVGSKFYFDIPIEIGREIIEKKFTSINHNIKKDVKLLLVEDNKSNQMFMKVILKKVKIVPDIANDGLEAVAMFKENSYDLILMDENMPNMNGIEATKQILDYEKENNLKHTLIVALTANALKGDRERFLEAGMDEYMTKPLDKEKLKEVLERL